MLACSIMASMTDVQLDRYEAFRRSSLARPKMKQVSDVETKATFFRSMYVAFDPVYAVCTEQR